MRKRTADLIKKLTTSYLNPAVMCLEAAEELTRLSAELESVKNANARMGGRLRQLYIAIDRDDLDEDYRRGGTSASRRGAGLCGTI